MSDKLQTGNKFYLFLINSDCNISRDVFSYHHHKMVLVLCKSDDLHDFLPYQFCNVPLKQSSNVGQRVRLGEAEAFVPKPIDIQISERNKNMTHAIYYNDSQTRLT